MAENTNESLFDFEIAGQVRVISFVRTVHVDGGIDFDLYYFTDDKTHELVIYTLGQGMGIPSKKIGPSQQMIEGYIQGKGTLTVDSPNGAKDNYYFEKEGHYKEVDIKPGQCVHWAATNDSGLVFYEVRDRLLPPSPGRPAKTAGRTAKLLLSSVAITGPQAAELVKLVGKPARSINLALIENAADVEPDSKHWVEQNRQAIQSHGFNVEIVDLKKYNHDPIDLLQKLQHKHVIWFGGGNTFYLRWLVHNSRADEIVRKLMTKGVVYGGGSAGAIIAGPTLAHFEAADDPGAAPELITDGLHLMDSVVVPHINNDKYGKIVDDINRKLLKDGIKTIPLNDAQAVVINGDTQRII